MAYAAANEMTLSSEVPLQAAVSLDDLEGVMRLYRGRILRYAIFAVRDRDVAETITQECFLKAYRARETFRGDCGLSTWLMHIAVNLVRDHARSRQLQFWRKAQATAIEISEVAEFLPQAGSSAEAGLLAREQLKSVWAAVDGLSRMQRQVFMLRFVEEMELKEISEVMEMKESTVKSHLYRALNSVRGSVSAGTGGTK